MLVDTYRANHYNRKRKRRQLTMTTIYVVEIGGYPTQTFVEEDRAKIEYEYQKQNCNHASLCVYVLNLVLKSTDPDTQENWECEA